MTATNDLHELYQSIPAKPWVDGTPVYSALTGEYYASPTEALEQAQPVGGLAELRLVLCVPVKIRKITDDYFEHCLPEDTDPPPALRKLIDDFNDAVGKLPLETWTPGPYLVAMEDKTT